MVTFNERSRRASPVRGDRTVPDQPPRPAQPANRTALGYGFVRSADSEPSPDLQFHFSPASYGAASSRRLDSAPGMTLGVYPQRPQSRGSIHIGSAGPARRSGDQAALPGRRAGRHLLVAGMRIARQIMGDPSLDAYRAFELIPGTDVQTADELLDYVRNHGDTSYHPVGTCRMGADPMAVVDHRLRVHGIAGLRVIDA